MSGIQTLDQLTEDVASMFEPLAKLDPERRSAIVQSWLALVARGRRADDTGRTEPLLAMQAQLWVRELRRLMRRVPRGDASGAPADPPLFAWHDELDPKQDDKALPIVHCRACGASGFGAVQKNDEAPLEGHPGRVGEAYLRRHKSARFLLPGRSGELFPHFLCAGCLRLGEKRRCSCGREDTLRVIVSAKCSAAKDGKANRFLRWCPACETNGSLRILGARAPSLSSVATTQLYASAFNEDKKLLAITDSVQDAAHLAGFFGARTYRFAVRTALVGAVADKDGLTLSDAADAMTKGTSFGLVASAVRLTAHACLLACSVCHENVLVAEPTRPSWEGAPCVRFRCPGRLAPSATKDGAYYSRLYQAKKVAHVATAEHTGLLSRPAREKLETRFKTGKDPFAPNLLVCTPTLEMGSTSAISRPPCSARRRAHRRATYSASAGRAGRRAMQRGDQRRPPRGFREDPEGQTEARPRVHGEIPREPSRAEHPPRADPRHARRQGPHGAYR